MPPEINFAVPASREFVGITRLVVSGLAPSLPVDSDTIEDMRLAVSEACANLIVGFQDDVKDAILNLRFAIGDSDITIDIGCPGYPIDFESIASDGWTDTKESAYGLSIITTLMDKVDLVSDGDNHSMLRMKKYF